MDEIMMEQAPAAQEAPEEIKKPIGRDQVRRAMETLEKYKAGKANLEQRIIQNEQFWKLRHWESLGKLPEAEPSSGWLVNVILNRHADAMDNYPEPNCLPRAADDQEEAQRLGKVLPVILKQNGYKQVYSACWWQKLKSGCGVYGVFWDQRKLGGMGDISIRKCDPLNLFWEPGVTDIQESANFFQVELVDNEMLEELYPQLHGKLQRNNEITEKYHYDDTVDTSGKSSVVDWYYKKHSGGKTVLHYCKFVGEEVLYATENEPGEAERGWYDHGKYPFVFDVLFPEEGMPCGFGYIDICKSPQKQIDLMNRAILENTLAAAKPRFFIRGDGAVNEAEFADWTKTFVHTNGNLGADSILPVATNQLSSIYVEYLNNKIQELRETSGNTESATGVHSAGVTAASAIAALQEASGKLSRDMIDNTYDAYERVVMLCIDLIRQFYALPRMFRITGEMGRQEFTSYDNRGLQPKPQVGAGGMDMGYRTPVFDIDVVPQSESQYNKQEYNNLALQLFGAGVFNPQLSDQALAAMSMMDFHGREELMQRIAQNGTLLQQVAALQQEGLQMAQMIDSMTGGNLADGYAQRILEQSGIPVPTATPQQESSEKKEEAANTAAARQQTQQAAKPR